MTTPNENDIKGAPNGDDHDAKFDPRPKWPFWIGISGRFRRNAHSRALALGEGLPMIGKLLGHTQVQTTARYAHLARDTVKASAARIGDSIDNDLDAMS